MYLKPNHIVSLYISTDVKATDNENLIAPFESYFTTEMCPMYTSIYEIKRMVGIYITGISDDIINQLIHMYSLVADDLATCYKDDKWQRFAGVWVALKVAFTLITNTEDFIQAGEGKVFKQLGDLSISREKAGAVDAGLSKMLSHLECELFKYEFAVRNCMPPLMDCLGLTSLAARPYVPKLAELVDKGVLDPNKPLVGRRWKSDPSGDTSGNNRIVEFGKLYGINRRR
jgi:hypothetical protein